MPSSPSRRAVIASGTALLAVAVTSCIGTPAPSPSTSAGGPSTPAEPQELFTFGTASQPLGLDPALNSDLESYRVSRQILEGLVGVDQTTGNPTPLLATEWEESDEGRAYTFTLRDGVTFHDGTAFNADAVCANFNRWFNFPEALRSQTPGSSFRSVFKAHADQPELSIFKACTAVAANVVRIELTQRFTGFLQALTLPAFAMSSPTALEAERADVLDQMRAGQPISAYASKPVGTGPFTLSTWDDTGITLLSNPGYWSNKGEIGTIRFVTYDHPETRLQALLDGKIDGFDGVTVGNFDKLIRRGMQIVQRDPFSVMYLGMNQEVPLLKDIKIRQAVEMAIDKESLIREFFIDNTAPATQFVPPKISGFNNNAPSLGYNPADARKLLAEAGYNGEELKFYYPLNATRTYLPTPEKIYAELSRQLTAVGFNIQPMPVDWADGYLQKITTPGDHAFHLLGWNGSYSDADNFVGPLFGSKTGEFGYQDPQVIAKINRARGLPEGEERDELYHTINEEVAAAIPAVPIAFPISALALSDRVLQYPASPVLNEVFTMVRLKP